LFISNIIYAQNFKCRTYDEDVTAVISTDTGKPVMNILSEYSKYTDTKTGQLTFELLVSGRDKCQEFLKSNRVKGSFICNYRDENTWKLISSVPEDDNHNYYTTHLYFSDDHDQEAKNKCLKFLNNNVNGQYYCIDHSNKDYVSKIRFDNDNGLNTNKYTKTIYPDGNIKKCLEDINL
jgi:hypothetical protein